MTKTILTERFKKDIRSKVTSRRVYEEIKTKVKYLDIIPTMGSTDLPESIIQTFGDGVRKLSNPPFLIIYEYDANTQTNTVYALIHERQAF